MKTTISIFFALALAVLLSACGKKTAVEPAAGTTNTATSVTAPEPNEPTDVPGTQAQAAVAPAPVKEPPLPTKPIDITTLKVLLPQTIRGFKLQNEQSRTNVKYTVKTTMAKRVYEDESDRKRLLFYTLIDTHKQNVLRVNSAHFFNPDKLVNDDTQNEIIVDYEGMPCLEMSKDAGGTRWSKFQVLVEDRVLVDIIGLGFPIEDLRQLRELIDIPLIREHVKEEIVQQEYRARQERDALKKAGLWPPQPGTAKPAPVVAVPAPSPPAPVAAPAPAQAEPVPAPQP